MQFIIMTLCIHLSPSAGICGAKAFSKAKPIREAPMKTPIAVKRTIPMNRREPVKRPMIRNESAQNFVPTKRKLPIRKVVPAKVPGGKVVPTKNSGAVIIGKPVLRMVPAKKCNPDTKSTTVKETLEKKPSEIIKSKRVDTNTKKPADVKIIPSTSPTETVAQPVVKEERKEEAKVLPSGQEYQELTHQLSCALDSELEDIMIKVWQELPENPATKAEELVVEKIRNEAGDDLRNVLGLNITKRLLNIHNSLYVKLHFKARPERGTLIQFIKKYKLKSFKRIRDDAPVFAAQFNNIDDYDRICNEEVYCGQVKVQVKPCYNFTSCPPNLRTIFSDKDIKQKINSEHCAEESVEIQKKQETQRKEPIEIKEAEKKQEDKNNEKKTIAKDSVKTDLSVETKSVTKNDNKIERTLIKVEKDESDINKDDKIKSQIADKSKMQVTHNVEAQTNVNKPKGIEVIEVKKEKEENKKVDNKVKEDNKESKGLVKENDEIEDQDVLALISEGIVLDECSGSDIE